jgi:hypothetical protein
MSVPDEGYYRHVSHILRLTPVIYASDVDSMPSDM